MTSEVIGLWMVVVGLVGAVSVMIAVIIRKDG